MKSLGLKLYRLDLVTVGLHCESISNYTDQSAKSSVSLLTRLANLKKVFHCFTFLHFIWVNKLNKTDLQLLTYQSQRRRTAAVGVLGGSYIPPQLPLCMHQAKGAPRAPDTHSAPGTWPWWLWTLHHSINTRQPLLILLSSAGKQIRPSVSSSGAVDKTVESK